MECDRKKCITKKSLLFTKKIIINCLLWSKLRSTGNGPTHVISSFTVQKDVSKKQNQPVTDIDHRHWIHRLSHILISCIVQSKCGFSWHAEYGESTARWENLMWILILCLYCIAHLNCIYVFNCLSLTSPYCWFFKFNWFWGKK